MSKTKLFVHGFSFDDSEQDRINIILELFSPFGTITEEDITIIPNREYGGLKNFSFVEYETKEEADAAIDALDGKTTESGLQLSVNVARPREDNGGGNRGGGRGGNRGGGNYGNNRGGGRDYNDRRDNRGGSSSW
jgi:RNA recognition motif-containing protein